MKNLLHTIVVLAAITGAITYLLKTGKNIDEITYIIKFKPYDVFLKTENNSDFHNKCSKDSAENPATHTTERNIKKLTTLGLNKCFTEPNGTLIEIAADSATALYTPLEVSYIAAIIESSSTTKPTRLSCREYFETLATICPKQVSFYTGIPFVETRNDTR